MQDFAQVRVFAFEHEHEQEQERGEPISQQGVCRSFPAAPLPKAAASRCGLPLPYCQPFGAEPLHVALAERNISLDEDFKRHLRF
jgi:hypothetical protein